MDTPAPRGTSGATIAVGLLAGAGAAFAAYRWIYLPRKRAAEASEVEAAAFRAQLESEARRRGGSGPDWANVIGTAGCTAAATVYAVPPAVSLPICSVVGGPLLKFGVKATVGSVRGTVTGVTRVGGSIVSAGSGTVKAVAKPIISIGKSIGKVFGKLF